MKEKTLANKLLLLTQIYPDSSFRMMIEDEQPYIISYHRDSVKDNLTYYASWRVADHNTQTVHALYEASDVIEFLKKKGVPEELVTANIDNMVDQAIGYCAESMEHIYKLYSKEEVTALHDDLMSYTRSIVDQVLEALGDKVETPVEAPRPTHLSVVTDEEKEHE